MVENLREKALKAYEAIFSNQETIEIDGHTYHMEYTCIQNLRKFRIEGYNYLVEPGQKQ